MTVERRLAEMHIEAARSKALRVFAFSGAVFPGEWNSIYTEEVVKDLLEFGFHARRVTQIAALDDHQFPSIHRLLVQLSEGDPGDWVENYHWALNRLMHVRSLILGHCHADHRKTFLASKANLIPSYVRIETDQREMATISLYGLVDCFLASVIPEIRVRHPDWRF